MKKKKVKSVVSVLFSFVSHLQHIINVACALFCLCCNFFSKMLYNVLCNLHIKIQWVYVIVMFVFYDIYGF